MANRWISEEQERQWRKEKAEAAISRAEHLEESEEEAEEMKEQLESGETVEVSGGGGTTEVTPSDVGGGVSRSSKPSKPEKPTKEPTGPEPGREAEVSGPSRSVAEELAAMGRGERPTRGTQAPWARQVQAEPRRDKTDFKETTKQTGEEMKERSRRDIAIGWREARIKKAEEAQKEFEEKTEEIKERKETVQEQISFVREEGKTVVPGSEIGAEEGKEYIMVGKAGEGKGIFISVSRYEARKERLQAGKYEELKLEAKSKMFEAEDIEEKARGQIKDIKERWTSEFTISEEAEKQFGQMKPIEKGRLGVVTAFGERSKEFWASAVTGDTEFRAKAMKEELTEERREAAAGQAWSGEFVEKAVEVPTSVPGRIGLSIPAGYAVTTGVAALPAGATTTVAKAAGITLGGAYIAGKGGKSISEVTSKSKREQMRGTGRLLELGGELAGFTAGARIAQYKIAGEKIEAGSPYKGQETYRTGGVKLQGKPIGVKGQYPSLVGTKPTYKVRFKGLTPTGKAKFSVIRLEATGVAKGPAIPGGKTSVGWSGAEASDVSVPTPIRRKAVAFEKSLGKYTPMGKKGMLGPQRQIPKPKTGGLSKVTRTRTIGEKFSLGKKYLGSTRSLPLISAGPEVGVDRDLETRVGDIESTIPETGRELGKPRKIIRGIGERTVPERDITPRDVSVSRRRDVSVSRRRKISPKPKLKPTPKQKVSPKPMQKFKPLQKQRLRMRMKQVQEPRKIKRTMPKGVNVPKSGINLPTTEPVSKTAKTPTLTTGEKATLEKKKRKSLADWIGATKTEFEFEKATTPRGKKKQPITGILKPVEEKFLSGKKERKIL